MTMWHQKPPLGRRINWDHPLSKQLSFAVPMNQGSGQLVESVHNIVSSSTQNIIWDNNRIEQGSTVYYIDFANHPSFNQMGDGPFTVASKYVGSSVGTPHIINNDGLGSNAGWNFQEYSNKVRFKVADGGGNVTVDSNTTFDTDEWFSVACVVDRTNQQSRIYINGTLDSPSSDISGITPISNTDKLTLFGTIAHGGAVNAGFQMEYLFIWKRALTPSEITNIYINPYAMFEPSVKRAWWTSGAAAISVTISNVLSSSSIESAVLKRLRKILLASVDSQSQVDAFTLKRLRQIGIANVDSASSVVAIDLKRLRKLLFADVASQSSTEDVVLKRLRQILFADVQSQSVVDGVVIPEDIVWVPRGLLMGVYRPKEW